MSPFLTSLLASGTIAAFITGVFLVINNRIQLRAHQPVEDSTAEKQRMEALQQQFALILAENARLRINSQAVEQQLASCSSEIRDLKSKLEAAEAMARTARNSEKILQEHMARQSAWIEDHYKTERRPKVGPPPKIVSATESQDEDDIT